MPVSIREIIFFIVSSIFELGGTTKCLLTASEFCFPASLNVLQSLHATLCNAGIVCKLPDIKDKSLNISHPHNQHCKGISAIKQGMYLETKKKGTGPLLSDKDWKGMDFLKLQLELQAAAPTSYFTENKEFYLLNFSGPILRQGHLG